MPDPDLSLRPIAHITPQRGWVNDPNGPVHHDGRYHLYYQLNPEAAAHADIRWGHSTSTDLVTWHAEPVAIWPTHALDRDGVYSGMTVSTPEGLVAYYSAFNLERRYQPVLRALSTDGGFSFGAAEQVVPEPDPALGIDEYRDPFVWREDGLWRMLMGCSMPDNVGAALLYESADLREWTYRGVFASATARQMKLDWDVDTGNMWEVPQYIEVGGASFLIVSAFRRGTGPMRVFSLAGRRSGLGFVADSCRYFDDGPDFFAASVLSLADGRTLVFGWGRESLQVPTPTQAWAGTLSFPRELRPRPDGQLGSWPLAELSTLRRGKPIRLGQGATPVPQAFEFRARVDVRDEPSVIDLHLTEHQRIRVEFQPTARRIVVDPSGAYTAAVITLEPDATSVEITWFVDHSISEFFVSDGSVATHRFYPGGEEWSLHTTGPIEGAHYWSLRGSLNDD